MALPTRWLKSERVHRFGHFRESPAPKHPQPPAPGFFALYDMEPELLFCVFSSMEKLGLFKLRLIGGTGMSLDILAETALIAIYRAAAVAIEAGATDFQLARHRPVRVCR